MLCINKKYLLLAVSLFLIEALIAIYVRDEIFRPYVGDFLVVLFLYCLLKSFWEVRVMKAVLLILSFACIIEVLQYFKLSDKLGESGDGFLSVVLGSHFDWIDLVAYILGALSILLIERMRGKWGHELAA